MNPRDEPAFAPIRGAIWLYFWLLILEGALRKWFLPGWSNAIFLARDPVVVVAYLFALRAGVFPFRPAITCIFVLIAASLIAGFFAVDLPWQVIVFGLRTDYLHLPLIFLVPLVMDRADVIRIGRWTLWLTIPVVILMLLQFNSSRGALVNVGSGGTVDGQIDGALGKIRPPGPFSFISGAVAFFGLATAFIYHGWLVRGTYPRWLVLIATCAVVFAIPISISRSMLMAVGTVVLFGLPASLRDLRRIPAFLGPLAAAAGFLMFAADTVYVQAFVYRWQSATAVSQGGFYGSVVLRILGTFTEPFTLAADAPLFGNGIGMGTMAGARLLTGTNRFLLAESELSRIVLELGPILGFVFIAWRLWLAVGLVLEGWEGFRRDEDPLAWLIAGATFLSVLSGQWGPSTQLGFAVFGAALCLAALNPPPEDSGEETDSAEATTDEGDVAAEGQP